MKTMVSVGVLGVVGCGGSDPSSTTRPTVRPTASGAIDLESCPGNASTVKAPESGTLPTVRVTLLVPRSGAFPHWSQFGDGARAYFQARNASPNASVHFEVNEVDDQLRATETKRAVEAAASDGTDLIVGVPTVANVNAVRQALSDACMPLFTPAPATADLAEKGAAGVASVPNDFVVASGLDLGEEVRTLISGTRSTAEPNGRDGSTGPSIGLVFQDNAYGRAYSKAVEAAAQEFDGRIVASEGFDPVSAPDSRDAVEAATRPKPDLLLLALEGAACPDALSFVPPDSARQIAVSAACTPDSVISQAGTAQLGVRAVVASIQPRDPDQRSLAAAEPFMSAMAHIDPTGGTNLTAEGWDTAAVAAAAVDQALAATSLSRVGVIAAARSLDGPAPTMWPAGSPGIDRSGSTTRSMLRVGELSERTKEFWRPVVAATG